MQDQNVATRLKLFIESEGISSSQFADACGIPRPSLSQLLTGRNKKISNTLLEQIHSTFPQLSVMWLVFGEGDMLNKANPDGDEDEVGMMLREEAPVPYNGNIHYKTSGYQTHSDIKPDGMSERCKQLEKENIELQREIERLKNSKRKVESITIYYDDSTFETFVPNGR